MKRALLALLKAWVTPVFGIGIGWLGIRVPGAGVALVGAYGCWVLAGIAAAHRAGRRTKVTWPMVVGAVFLFWSCLLGISAGAAVAAGGPVWILARPFYEATLAWVMALIDAPHACRSSKGPDNTANVPM